MAKGSSNVEVRIYNTQRIVNALYLQGPMTKHDLAERLSLSPPTVSVILKELTAKGLVAPGEKLKPVGGRPPTHIRIAFDSKVSIGVDVAQAQVRIALVDLGPRMVAQAKYPLDASASADPWSQVHACIERFIAEHAVDPGKLLGVGLSVHVPIEDGVPRPPASEDASEVRAPEWDFSRLRRELGHRLEIFNGAKMAGLAQAWGIGDTHDFVYLMLDETVGGAVLSQRGLIDAGPKNAEFGHLPVAETSDVPCACGRRGCLDACCSARALRLRTGVEPEDFFARLDAGDARFVAIWEEYLDRLATGVHALRMCYDRDVVLGGALSVPLAGRLDALRARLARRNPFGDGGSYVRIAGFGEFDSAFGAALMHNDRYLS